MALPTVTVTVRFNDQSGAPVPGATVVAKLTTTERYGGYVVPKEYRGETDLGGVALIDVFPNELGSEGSEYQFQIRDNRTGKSVKVFAVVPNADCELHNIAELEPYDMRGTGQVITAEIAGYSSAASSSAAAAATSATAAGTARTAAEAAKEAAETALSSVNINLDALGAAVAGATTAKTAAEAARDQSVVYRDSANTYSQTATAKAGEAATSATSAATQASNAANSANTATTKANDAATSAASAATSATSAASSATTATTKATAATTSASNAATAESSAATHRESSQAWATSTPGSFVSGTAEYSSKHYAYKSKDWAEKTPGVTVETGAYSAKHHATAAASSASDSSGYATTAYNEANRAKAEADRAAGIAAGSIPDATESTKGIAEIATALETATGTDDFRIVTPLKLKGLLDTRVTQANESTLGMVRLANAGEVTAGTDAQKVVTPLTLQQKVGTDTVIGMLRFATDSEATGGVATTSAINPKQLKNSVDALKTEIVGKTISVSAPLTGGGSLSGASISIGVGAASESVTGVVELADATEATAGTDGTKALSPLRAKALFDLKAPLASPTFTGTPSAPTASVGTATTQIATTAFVAAATPAATDTTAGKVELATNAEAQTGSDTARAVTPAALKSVLTAVATEYTGLLGNIDEKYQNLGTVSGATGINLSSGNVLSATISAATTFSFTGATSAKSRTFLLILTNGGAYAVTWPSSVKWAGGAAPILTTAGVDMLFFNSIDGGTTWRANAIKDVK